MYGAIVVVLPIILFSIISQLLACNISVNILSKTSNPFQIQIAVPNGIVSDRLNFTAIDETRQFVVTGNDCAKDSMKWKMEVYKKTADDAYELARTEEAIIDGEGHFGLRIHDDYRPTMFDRHGIWCSQGTCA